jgi:hypothetical protein
MPSAALFTAPSDFRPKLGFPRQGLLLWALFLVPGRCGYRKVHDAVVLRGAAHGVSRYGAGCLVVCRGSYSLW